MPFSRSRSIESMTRSATSWFWRNAPDCQSMASTSVVLPWSTWATIATLRRSSRTAMSRLKLAAAREHADDLARRPRLGQLVRLTRPEVHRTRVARRPRSGTEWRGGVVDLRIRTWRVRVFVHEAVEDAAGEATREGARERGRRLGRDRG